MNKLWSSLYVCLTLSVAPAMAQTTRVVDDDGQGTAANCDGSSAAFTTVGAGITAATAGDTVLVCPGTYFENIDFGGKAVSVRSIDGPAVTILDGSSADSVVRFTSGETATSVLEGFTIRNGFAQFEGGGIQISSSSPVIRRNLIVSNSACSGAGISIAFASPLIEENTIANNLQGGCFGGTTGAGVYIRGSAAAILRRNNIYNNSGTAFGGGLSLFAAGAPTIEFNAIWGNSADEGGGIDILNDTSARIVGNLIVRNEAGTGGGIYWSSASGIFLANNTIAENHSPEGSGIYADGSDVGAVVVNNVIVAAAGQTALFCGDFSNLTTRTFRSNNVFSAAGAAYAGMCGDATGLNGNISADPLFVNPAANDYHLLPGSPNIDSGDSSVSGLPAADLDRHLRPLDGNGDGLARIDIGSDEAPATPGTMPAPFSKSSPPNAALVQGTTVSLNWIASSGATSYEYCYDTVNNNACDGTWISNWNGTVAPITGLSGGTTYYWQVRANNAAGTTYADGGPAAYRSFTTPSPPTTRIILLTGNLAFGTVAVGNMATRILTISNTGNSMLTVRRIIFPSGFSGNWMGTIAAGGSQDVTVTFWPSVAATYSGTITVWADQTGGTPRIAVSGTGTTVATRVIALSGNLAFGNVAVGRTATRTLTIRNTGTATLTVSRVAYPAGFSGNWSGSIPPGGSQDVAVTFAPIAPITYSGFVVVTANHTSGTNELVISGTGVSARRHTVADFDGDGRADLSVWRPSTGQWFTRLSASNYASTSLHAWGGGSDVPLPRDYDGDDQTDIAVWRPSTGQWFIRLSSTGYTTVATYAWGTQGDVPIPADFDGDGRADPTVYRPSTGQWFVLQSSTNHVTPAVYHWGALGDTPIVDDIDGDTRAEIGVWRPSTGQWFLLLSTMDYEWYVTLAWGAATDTPLIADFDGDGVGDIGVRRPSTGQWFILMSSTDWAQPSVYTWGAAGDTPLVSDFDGDGRADISVWRPGTGEWYVRGSVADYSTFVRYIWGGSGDIVVAAVR